MATRRDSIPQSQSRSALSFSRANRVCIFHVQLKKVINAVSAELHDLGLTSEVLQDLLANREDDALDSTQNRKEDALLVEVDQSEIAGASNGGDDKGGDVKASVQAVEEEEEVGAEDGVGQGELGKPVLSEKAQGKRAVRKRGARASYELSGSRNSVPRSLKMN